MRINLPVNFLQPNWFFLIELDALMVGHLTEIISATQFKAAIKNKISSWANKNSISSKKIYFSMENLGGIKNYTFITFCL